jgi:hypothetical protein
MIIEPMGFSWIWGTICKQSHIIYPLAIKYGNWKSSVNGGFLCGNVEKLRSQRLLFCNKPIPTKSSSTDLNTKNKLKKRVVHIDEFI